MWPSWRAHQSRGKTSGHLSTASVWWPAPCPEQGVRVCAHRVSVPMGLQGVAGYAARQAHRCFLASSLSPYPPPPLSSLPGCLEADRPADVGDQSSFRTRGQSPGCPHPVLARRHWHISLLRTCSLIYPRWLSVFIPDFRLSGVVGGGRGLGEMAECLGNFGWGDGPAKGFGRFKGPESKPFLGPQGSCSVPASRICPTQQTHLGLTF